MSNKLILVVDDSDTDFLYTKKILEKTTYEVVRCVSGSEAVQQAEEIQPDVILMDIVMSDMDGFKATRLLMKNENTAHIPVIMLSSKSTEIDKAWARRQGARGYLTKPVKAKTLIHAIESKTL